ncbi:MAG: CRISPR-associated protein Cas4, partial [Bacillota bacterium]
MNEQISITPSEVIEYQYCPRFIYFMLYLKIPQRQGKRYKVQVGRQIHEDKSKRNRDYLRQKLGVEDKLIEQKLYSKKYRIHGIVDEILFLEDGTAAPLDYKFAKYKDRLYNTYRYQAVMYSMLIADNYDVEVNYAYIIYKRSKSKLKEIEITKEDFAAVESILV